MIQQNNVTEHFEIVMDTFIVTFLYERLINTFTYILMQIFILVQKYSTRRLIVPWKIELAAYYYQLLYINSTQKCRFIESFGYYYHFYFGPYWSH